MRIPFVVVAASALGSLASVACSSNGGNDPGGSATGGTAGSGTSGDGLSLLPPVNGFQLSLTGGEIQSGEDIEQCEVLEIPGTPNDVYYVNEFTIEMAAFSHHLNVYSVEIGSAVDGEAQLGDRHTCLQPNLGYTNAGTFGEAFRYVIGSQTRTQHAKYPTGVGFKYYGGQKIIFNFHYLNTSMEAVPARARLNFHTVDAAEVTRTPQMFAMLNTTIDIPRRSTADFTMQCTVTQDIDVLALVRHTHRWGTAFDAWYVGGPRDGEHLFTSAIWDADNQFRYDPPMRVKAGEGFRFRCAFDNTTDGNLVFGDKALDEMCILYGNWTATTTPVQSQSCWAGPGVDTPDENGVVHGMNIGWPVPTQ